MPTKTRDSQKNCYLEDDFYNKAEHFLNDKTEKQLRLSANHPAGNKDRSNRTPYDNSKEIGYRSSSQETTRA